MIDDLQFAANNMLQRLISGDLTAIAELYAFPAAAYFGDRVLVFEDETDLLAAIKAYRNILRRNGLSRAQSTVLNRPHARPNKLTLDVLNTYHREDGSCLGKGRIRYFIQKERTGYCIRLVEYLSWPCAEEMAQDPVLASLSQWSKTTHAHAACANYGRRSFH